jgi:hypothetical protein
MERVSQATVLRHWLALERRKRDDERPPPEALDERTALDELLEYKPGAADFVWRDAPVEWYRTTLDAETFDRLRVVGGPDGLLWRALSADGTVRGCAERIARGDPDRLAAETGVDIDHVLDLRDRKRDRDRDEGGEDVGGTDPLVLSTRRGCAPYRVADGNHRAVAVALAVLEGEAYTPMEAFVGVGSNPVLRPAYERLCGVVRDVRRRLNGRIFKRRPSDQRDT